MTSVSKSFYIKSTPDFFTVDALGNTYLIEGNQVKKYDTLGNLLFTYSDKTLNKIDFMDVSNTMKPFVYSSAQSKIVFLDNMLATNGTPIDVGKFCSNACPVIVSSFNNSIWMLNYSQSELVKVDQYLNVLQISSNLQLMLGYKINPCFMIESMNYVYVSDTAKGILIFDQFGTYNKTIPLKNIRHFQVDGSVLVYLKNDKLNFYNFKTFEESIYDFVAKNVKKAYLVNNKIYFQTIDGIFMERL